MLNKRIIAVVSILALTLLAFSAAHVVAKPGGGGCTVRDSGCKAENISFSVYTGTPTVPCLQGATVYTFSATITCGIGFGDPVSGLVCSAAHNSISFSLNGQTHTFAPASGHTWQDVKDDCSSYLTYSVN
jgi:hypothetical protein